MKARSLELRLLFIVALVTATGYGLVALGITSTAPDNTIAFLIVVLGLLLAAHFGIRLLAPFADGTIFPIVGLLNALGYVMIARIKPDLAANQAAWTFIGMGVFCLTLVFIKDIQWLESYKYLLAIAGVFLLLTPLIPGLGVTINGARIWLRVGSFSIQPGEFAKVVFAAFLAGYLIDKRELLQLDHHKIGPIHLPPFKYLAPLIFAWGVALVVMVLQRDLGSSLLFFTLFLVMIYVATSRLLFVVLGLSVFSAAAYGSWARFSHVQSRVTNWLDPFADPKDGGFQILEAQFAAADGGLFGTGIGQGSPHKIPYSESDMIFAAIAEELGLLGATAVLTLFLLFVASGLRIALSAASGFETLFALGLTFLLGFQAFVIIGGVLRVLPLTGVTLPFVSYGGSSLVANYIILAILVKISHNSVQQTVKGWDESPGLSEAEKVRWKEVKV